MKVMMTMLITVAMKTTSLHQREKLKVTTVTVMMIIEEGDVSLKATVTNMTKRLQDNLSLSLF
jgi:hypothetical protein